MEYVKNGEIVLNISPNATHKLQIGNELSSSRRASAASRARSRSRSLNVYALYARETGHGMTFDLDGAKPSVQAKGESEAVPTSTKPPAALPPPAPDPKKPTGGKPTLRRIK